MAWQVLITDNALADLREIVEFVVQDDAGAAERMGHRLVARALDLATMPERHPLHNVSRSIRKLPIWFSTTATLGTAPFTSFIFGAEPVSGRYSISD